MLASDGNFVVKLPHQRVNALVSAKDAKLFRMGGTRVMKERIVVTGNSKEKWLSIYRGLEVRRIKTLRAVRATVRISTPTAQLK